MSSINPVFKSPTPVPEAVKREGVQGKSFVDTLKTFYEQVDGQMREANQKSEAFAVGQNYDLHEVIIATEKADISFRLLNQIRNKVLEAYQEIMRMQF
jgi:flagellar hook-basal body complex protein FliE